MTGGMGSGESMMRREWDQTDHMHTHNMHTPSNTHTRAHTHTPHIPLSLYARRGWALLCTTLRCDLTQGIFNQLRLPLGIEFSELQVQPFRNANAAQLAGLSVEQMCVGC
jgi:hypothetical protein